MNVEVNGMPVEIPNLPTCDVRNLMECNVQVTNFMIKYVNNTGNKIADLNNKFALTNHTLTDFSNIYGSAGLADNTIFGLDLVKFTEYPTIETKYDQRLYDLQNDIKKALSTSTMLAGDSSFVQFLKTNDIMKGLAEVNPELADLIKSLGYYNTLTNQLVNPETMRQILGGCFSGGDYQTCGDFLSEYKLTDSDDRRISINEYINQLKKLTNQSIFKAEGYYSDSNPALANFFWLKLKDTESRDILLPINLNNITANSCPTIIGSQEQNKLTDYILSFNQPQIGTLFNDYVKKDPYGDKVKPELLITPDDLLIYPTYDSAGNIISVRRSADSMNGVSRNKEAYNQSSIKCERASIFSTVANKNVSYSKCADPFGDFNGLQFYTDSVATLKDALANYMNKPIINRGYHKPVTDGSKGDTSCSDIGARYLTPNQPWCTPDNLRCLKITNDGYVQDVNNAVIPATTKVYGTANNMNELFLNPSSSEPSLFWYNTILGTKAAKIPGLYGKAPVAITREAGTVFNFDYTLLDPKYEFLDLENSLSVEFKLSSQADICSQIARNDNSISYHVYTPFDGSSTFNVSKGQLSCYSNEPGITKLKYTLNKFPLNTRENRAYYDSLLDGVYEFDIRQEFGDYHTLLSIRTPTYGVAVQASKTHWFGTPINYAPGTTVSVAMDIYDDVHYSTFGSNRSISDIPFTADCHGDESIGTLTLYSSNSRVRNGSIYINNTKYFWPSSGNFSVQSEYCRVNTKNTKLSVVLTTDTEVYNILGSGLGKM